MNSTTATTLWQNNIGQRAWHSFAPDLTAPIQKGNAVIYMDDPGVPVARSGMKCKLTVLNGAGKSEVVWVVAGEKLEALRIKLAKGAKFVASRTTPAAKAITVRFTVK